MSILQDTNDSLKICRLCCRNILSVPVGMLPNPAKWNFMATPPMQMLHSGKYSRSSCLHITYLHTSHAYQNCLHITYWGEFGGSRTQNYLTQNCLHITYLHALEGCRTQNCLHITYLHTFGAPEPKTVKSFWVS